MIFGWDEILRLSFAFVLGALVGYEREVHQRPAGLRTHILISLAAALFTLISISFTGPQSDPARIAANILVGMGFVGAGVVISSRGEVHGVTTAASLWITAAIGMAAGLGEFLLAGFSTLLVLTTLAVLWKFEPRSR